MRIGRSRITAPTITITAEQRNIGSVKSMEDNGDTDLAVAAYQKLLKDFPEPHREASHQSNNITENHIQSLRSAGL